MAFIVIFDACVLYPAPLRDFLIRIACTGRVQARWSEAIRAGAQSVVTFNLKDFPDDKLGRYGVDAKHPDEFVLEQIELAPSAIADIIAIQAQSLKTPPCTVPDLLDTLQANGLVQSVERLRELLLLKNRKGK